MVPGLHGNRRPGSPCHDHVPGLKGHHEFTFRPDGGTALVAGYSRRIGNALARALADAGATVVLNGINEERLKASETAMAADGGMTVVV